MNLRRLINAGVVLGLFALLPPLATATPAGHRYVVRRAAYTSIARFVVTYAGSASYRTSYHAEPPNPGSNHDTNDANDKSTFKWDLRFGSALTIPACTGSVGDPCRRVRRLAGPHGAETATGVIDHVHVDGMIPADNESVSCQLHTSTRRGARLSPWIGVRYVPHSETFVLTAFDPVIDALTMLPAACPQQGDPTDGLFDSYYTPGFSFAPGYGPERWFQAGRIAISSRVLHRSRLIRIPLSLTRAGVAPRDCSVQHPQYERCTTGGRWAGVLTLKLG